MTLDKLETRKDVTQAVIESGVDHVGRIVTIIVGAVGDVTSEVGDWATDVFELRVPRAALRGTASGARAARSSLPRRSQSGTFAARRTRDRPGP